MIAGSASNGGAAVLRAGEADTTGLIDGIVAAEPVTELPNATAYGIQFGGVAVGGYGKRLADFTTYGNVYQPCAALRRRRRDDRDLGLQLPRARPRKRRRQTARCTSLAGEGAGQRRRHGRRARSMR